VEIKVNISDICVPSAHVLSFEIEGRIVIVSLLKGIADIDQQIYSLSETGLAIWQKLDGARMMGRIAAELSEQFSCPFEKIERDVLVIVSELLQLGICEKLNSKQNRIIQLKNNVFNNPGERESIAYIKSASELRLSSRELIVLLNRIAERGVPLRKTIYGISMQPFIRDCDILTITPLKECKPEIGDIVYFTNPDSERLIIHRIIEKAAIGWLLKGDNCPEPDGVINEKQIIGKVTRIERGEKEVLFGLGFEKKLIAFLNRDIGLVRLKKLWLLPRRIAGFMLHKLQGFSVYRMLGRHFVQDVDIRIAEESDMEAVNYLLNLSVPYCSQTVNPKVTNLIAVLKEKVIGYAELVYHPEDHYPWVGFWLFSLHVWNLYRRLGVGEKLVKYSIEEAKKKGASEIFLLVDEDNRRAINLDHKLGFEPVIITALEPLLKEVKEKTGRRRIVMRKSLECSDG
jgi:signal peptidase I